MPNFHARVHLRQSAWAPNFSRELTAEALGQALVNVAVRQLTATPESGYEAELVLQRPGHEDALREIAAAVAQLGFAVGEAFIVEYASAVVESAVSGLLGGGALGAAATRNPAVALVSAAVGAYVGASVGNFIQIERARYHARWNPYANAWEISQLAAPEAPQIRFGYA